MSEPRPTVLVVEDEFLIREWTADYLAESGFTVHSVGDVQEAIRLLGSRTQVDLVFTDITLPGGVSGFDLVQWIRENQPGLPVVLTSGGHNATKAAEVCADLPFVSKPYDLSDLARRFRALLTKGTLMPTRPK